MMTPAPRVSRIGIPRSFYYYQYPALWEAFFGALGIDCVLSPPSSPGLIAAAAPFTEGEHCLAHKIFDGQLLSLLGRVDALFIPRLISMSRRYICCAKFGALPDASRALLRSPVLASGLGADTAEEARRIPVLSPEINENKRSLYRTLAAFASELLKSGFAAGEKRAAGKAAASAIHAMKIEAMKRACRAKSGGLPGEGRFLLLGHSYTVEDPFMTAEIKRKAGEMSIPLEVFGPGAEPEGAGTGKGRPPFIRWCGFDKMYRRLLDLDRNRYRAVIHLSTFNCGPDSVFTDIFRRLCRSRGLPFLALTLDEHTAFSGIETRLEAFADSFRWRPGTLKAAPKGPEGPAGMGEAPQRLVRRRAPGPPERLAIPNLGNYTVALDSAVRAMGVEPWSSTCTGREELELGIAAAPESICLPFKAHLGRFIAAARAGCGHALMVNSMGTCRLTYYRHLIENILRDLGLEIHLWGLGFDGIKPPIIRYFDPAPIPFAKAVLLALEKIRVIDLLETEAWKSRPRERDRGAATRLFRESLAVLSGAETKGEVRKLGPVFKARFRDLWDKDRFPLDGEGDGIVRIGLIGETSLLRDRTLNHDIEEKLGGLGAELRNFFLLGAELANIFGVPAGRDRSHTRRELAGIARPYLNNPVGGHALDSTAHTLRCAAGSYDGMVHLCPAGCMPEVSVRPIIADISRREDFPVLELSFDEHSAGEGLITRLEAFVDLLRDRKRRLR
ncbi:MAG: acyl-CoA dehydratase activase-related protein [Treponema sp.]|jgi:predicted nucleotide-binding protein (sugar kinase/HSP70/actin superfamily)|nr:acyl-CoA dehydratase activase-related protein [Treponema sp.]